eukprot:1677564-Rhodomonas_salina.1
MPELLASQAACTRRRDTSESKTYPEPCSNVCHWERLGVRVQHAGFYCFLQMSCARAQALQRVGLDTRQILSASHCPLLPSQTSCLHLHALSLA